jgi:hypothetical protein
VLALMASPTRTTQTGGRGTASPSTAQGRGINAHPRTPQTGGRGTATPQTGDKSASAMRRSAKVRGAGPGCRIHPFPRPPAPVEFAVPMHRPPHTPQFNPPRRRP